MSIKARRISHVMIVTAKCSAGIVCLATDEQNIKGFLSIPEYSRHVLSCFVILDDPIIVNIVNSIYTQFI